MDEVVCFERNTIHLDDEIMFEEWVVEYLAKEKKERKNDAGSSQNVEPRCWLGVGITLGGGLFQTLARKCRAGMNLPTFRGTMGTEK